MFGKNKKKVQQAYENKLCMGFNGGVMLSKKLTPSNQPIFRAILESLAQKHKNDPIFRGLLEGLDHETTKVRTMRSSQLKRIENNQSKSKDKGWQR